MYGHAGPQENLQHELHAKTALVNPCASLLCSILPPPHACISGSNDHATKFLDLETFELVGAAGPEVG